MKQRHFVVLLVSSLCTATVVRAQTVTMGYKGYATYTGAFVLEQHGNRLTGTVRDTSNGSQA